MSVFGSVSWSALCVRKESKFLWQKTPSTSPTPGPPLPFPPPPPPPPPHLRLQLGTHPTSMTKISQLFSLISFITFLTIWPISRHFNFVFWSPLWRPRTGNLDQYKRKRVNLPPQAKNFSLVSNYVIPRPVVDHWTGLRKKISLLLITKQKTYSDSQYIDTPL